MRLVPSIRATLAIVILIALAAILAMPAQPVSAHAYLDRSNPEAGDVVEEAPEEVGLWFTEPLEPDHSFALLYDASGEAIDAAESRMDPNDPFVMYLSLPDDLPNGTYTVQWRNISAADGHSQSGFFAFTIGSRDDMTAGIAPPEGATTGDPGLLEPISRWLSYIGITTAVGTVFAWLWVIRPAMTEYAPSVLVTARRRTRTLALIGLGLAVIGALMGLSAQTIIVTLGFGLSNIQETLFTTQYGLFWSLRMVQFGMLGSLLYSGALWRQSRVRRTGWLAAGIALLALLPFSMSSHAAAVSIGTMVAILTDWLHLAATAVWIGGLIALLVAAILPTRWLEPEDRRRTYADLIPRFSTLAMISIIILFLSGIYSTWLQVGSIRGLWETEYGRILLLKLILSVPLFLLGGLNLMVVGPWMRRAAVAGKHFGRAIAVEITLGVAVLAVVAVLVSTAPARNTLQSQAERMDFRFEEQDLTTAVYISPGAVGQNNYTVDVVSEDGALPEDTQVELRVSPDGEVGGVRQIELERIPEADRGRSARFGAEGTDLSVPGTWELEIVVRRPGVADWRVDRSMEVPEIPAQDQVPGPPPRFEGLQAMGAPIGLAVAIVCGIVAARRRFRTEADRILGWVGAMFLVFGLLTIWQTHVQTTPTTQTRNPIVLTMQSVQVGQELYMEHCAMCHGPEGNGRPQEGVQLSRPPADLTMHHIEMHTDGDLHWWIKDGKGPDNVMPAFGDHLSDEQMWHLVNYIRSLTRPVERAAR